MSARPHGHRRRWIVLGAIAVVALAIGGVAATAIASSQASSSPPSEHRFETAVVRKGNLAGTFRTQGTLAYTGEAALAAGVGGTVTWLPAVGAVIGQGTPLYLVDNRPVILFHGALPAWRSFAAGMTDGPDVEQLEKNLADLGYFNRTPDQKFSSVTTAAIKAWQKATGQEVTGVVDFGRVLFAQGDLRISAVKAIVGGQLSPGAEVGTTTGTTKTVTLKLKLTDQAVAVVGAAVRVNLPSGPAAPGKITSLGAPTQMDDGVGGKVTRIPVVVTLDDPAAGAEVQQADVSVDIPTKARADVLYVPVEALLALSDSRFGIEVVGEHGKTRRIGVTTGAFVDGNVEISGSGVGVGQKVVVPSL